ncbi:hypothetical protein AX17_005358 [Amanita inopinata Kibby_2008]|nr:hypothetical protein AX17_005358 [Amanita inopinata Kibby_2008]
MEATFDNRTNVLNAHIRATHDNSIIYTVSTTFGLWGRKLITVLKDANPPPDEPTIVGAINWKDRYFEVHAHRRPLSEIKRKGGKFLKKSRYWRWSPDRREYEIRYHKDEWQVRSDQPTTHDVTTNKPKRKYKALLSGGEEEEDKELVGTFSVPFRPHLIGKSKSLLLDLSRKALEKDEVFLILLLIYSEAKRQEEVNIMSADDGAGGW